MRSVKLPICALLFLASAVFAADFLNTAVIDDFENPKLNKLGGPSGAWTIDPTNPKVFTKMEVVQVYDAPGNSSKALKLSYSVDSEKEALTGYWTLLNNFDAGNFDALEFYVKGDKKDGYTDNFKIEIKKPKPDSKIGEKLAGTAKVQNITDKWQIVRIPLYSLTGIFDKSDPELWKDHSKALKNLSEFVIAFNKRGVSRNKGTIYIYGMRFVNTGEDYQTVFDAPEKPKEDKACIVFRDKAFKASFMLPESGQKDKYTDFPADISTVAKAEAMLKAHEGSRIFITDGAREYWLHLNDNGALCFLDRDNYMKFLLDRMNGFPSKTVVKKKFPSNDREFLKEIARDTWKYFDNIIDKEYGLTLDTIMLDKKDVMGPDTMIADYTNITNIGVYLCCVVSAYDLGFITKDEAVARLRKTLDTVGKMPAHSSGFLYNYYDTTWMCKTDYLVSFVDSGWLAAGVIVAKNAFPQELGTECGNLLSRWDFGFFYDELEGHMYHGLLENLGVYSDYHYGIFYTEPRLTSFIAIGRGDVTPEHWFRMTRTFPESYDWTTQKPKGRKEKISNGYSYWGGWYEYRKSKFVPSWGGSMFEALMPTMLIDEKNLAPNGLGLNDATYVKATIDYTLNELKYPVWGMSPSSDPEGGYGEFGVKLLGTKGYPAGPVTPHVSFLALEFAPKESIENIRKMLKGWDVYGEYGFYDALDVKTKKVAYKYLGLDQGMILMSIDNFLNNGALKKYFQKDPLFKKAGPLLSSENFFE